MKRDRERVGQKGRRDEEREKEENAENVFIFTGNT